VLPLAQKILEDLLLHFLQTLEGTFTQTANLQVAENQEHICALIQGLLNRLPLEDVVKYSDRVMNYMYFILKSQTGSYVSEEVFLTVGVLVNLLEDSFQKYVNDQFFECMIIGMRNWQDYKSCKVCIGVVGDIARSVGKKILKYCDEIVRTLLDDVRNVDLDRSVKPAILSCFGDISMAIRGDFVRYVEYVFQILEQACQTVASITIVDVNDDDLLDFVIDFCMAILESYSGIIHGLDETKEHNNVIAGQLKYIATLIVYIAQNRHILQNESLEKAAIGCLGDLFQNLEKDKTAEFAKVSPIREYVEICKKSDDEEIKRIGQWVYENMPK